MSSGITGISVAITSEKGEGTMNIGVEVLKESVIRVQSQLNDWMDCVFVVSKDDEEKAREVLEKAWDSFWEDGDGWCYGNYLEDKVIEAVYTWHPAINDTTGKDQMKTLYTQFGFGVIRGMLPVAEKMEKLDGERRELLAQLDTIKIREGLLAVGDMELEETIEKVNELYMKANTEEKFEQMMKSLDVRNEIKSIARKVIGC